MMKSLTVTAAALILPTAMLSACASDQSSTAKSSSSSAKPTTSTTAAPPPGVERMVAELKKADGTVVAKATLDFRNGITLITVDTVGQKPLQPGFHGLHIHSVGKCEGDFSSAGGHFQKSGHTGHPASGDLTSLEIRSDGSGTLTTTTDAFTPTDLLGGQKTALIIHEGPDNFGNIPSRYSTHGESGADQQTLDTGDSGGRLACGVIESVNVVMTSTTTTTTTTTFEPPPQTFPPETEPPGSTRPGPSVPTTPPTGSTGPSSPSVTTVPPPTTAATPRPGG